MADVKVTVRPNGPYLLEGPVTLLDAAGNPFPIPANKPRLALCRCGGSANKPFCDGTHNKIGFQAPETAPSPTPAAPQGG